MSYPRFGRAVVLLLSLALVTGCVPVSADRHAVSQSAAPTVPATPTPDAAARDTITAVMAGTQPVTQTFPSPDGVWQAEIAVYKCVAAGSGDEGSDEYAFEGLYLERIDTGSLAQVDSQLINCGGLGAYGIQGLCWSADSRYFYYDMAREGVPDGNGEWIPPVRQLEIDSGMIRELSDRTTATGDAKDTLCSSTQP